MSEGLQTDVAGEVLQRLRPRVKEFLAGCTGQHSDPDHPVLRQIRDAVAAARPAGLVDDDDFLTDMFVLDRYVDLLAAYGTLWGQILGKQFSASWSTLQDALDLLRLVKRFSTMDVRFFEEQLVEVEKAYPDVVFASVGMTVDCFECSICGLDIDSLECPHMRGHLYLGKMAYGMARNIKNLDHVSLVIRPEDKRCVVSYEDTGEQFTLIRRMSEAIVSERFGVTDFKHLRFIKRRVPNPNYVQLGRNDRCFCGSGRKFKRCCATRKEIEIDHVDVIFEPTR